MVIGPARPEDVPALAALDAAAFHGPGYPAFFFRQAVDAWPSLVQVARGPEGLLGYALGAPAEAPGEAWMLALATAPEARGRGLGRALAVAWLGAAAALGRPVARLTVHPDNAAALGLYGSLGFVRDSADPAWFGPGEPRWGMVRRQASEHSWRARRGP